MANEQELLEPSTEEVPSLRETIEAAVDQHEGPEQPTQPSAPTSPAPVAPAQQAVTPPAPQAPTPQTPPQAPGKPEPLKAPSQWKPHVREQWNRLPREVQEEVLRREADSMRLIGSVGPKIRVADEVMQGLAPYAEHLQRVGVGPQQFMSDIFSTVHSLARGSAQEKAEVAANIIQTYGVDLHILDAMLTQRIRTPIEVQHARNMTERARMVLEQQRFNEGAAQEHQVNLEAERHVVAFGADPKHEFLDDVRDLMADLIESGRAENLEDAYAAAVWANPDTRKILLQREAQTRAFGKNQRAQAARRASSSISGSPTSGAAASFGGKGMSLRESIEAAIDEHSTL